MVSESRSYDHSFEEVRQVVLDALDDLGFELEETGRNLIRASTGMSLLSWGENIEIRLIKENGGIRVNISSEAPSQLFDWGKSQENVTSVLSAIEKRLENIE